MSHSHITKTFKTIPKYGTSPSIIYHISVNNFKIHDNFQHCFQIYFLLYWKGSHFLSEMNKGIITRGTRNYLVVFGENTSRGKIMQNPDSQVALSFREASHDFDIPPYVIVKLV